MVQLSPCQAQPALLDAIIIPTETQIMHNLMGVILACGHSGWSQLHVLKLQQQLLWVQKLHLTSFSCNSLNILKDSCL